MMVLLPQVKDQDKKEEANDKTEQSNGKKVPVLTLSLRPGKDYENVCNSVCSLTNKSSMQNQAKRNSRMLLTLSTTSLNHVEVEMWDGSI